MADRLPFSGEQYWNAVSRNAFPGAKLYTYDSQSRTTLKATFTDAGAGTPHTNPVIADANGLFDAIYGNGEYFIDIYNTDDTILIYQEDEVFGTGTGGGNTTTTVSLIADLRLVDTTTFQSAFVEGSTAIDDGGQNRFFFDASSAATDNSLTVVAPTVGTGRWIALAKNSVTIRYITANETYTPPVNVTRIELEVIGAGGGAGGIAATGGGETAVSGSGGAGSTLWFTTATIDASYTIVAGAGGAGGAAGNNNGVAGGDSTVTSSSQTLTAGGGTAGTGGAFGAVGTAGVQGTATNGDINVSAGGAWFPEGIALATDADGVDATLVGNGGGPSFNNASQVARSGGDGFRGHVKLTEYL